MAAAGDTENQSHVNVTSNEETPLLAERRPSSEGEEELDDEGEEEPKKTSHVSWYAWRIFWVVIVGLLLAVFIKGWVDAGGDVQVCFFSFRVGKLMVFEVCDVWLMRCSLI
jgi:hypothetical protein